MANGTTLTEKDIDLLEDRFKDVFATKDDLVEYKSGILDKLDSVLHELVKIRENQEVLTPVTSDLRERVEKIEETLHLPSD